MIKIYEPTETPDREVVSEWLILCEIPNEDFFGWTICHKDNKNYGLWKGSVINKSMSAKFPLFTLTEEECKELNRMGYTERVGCLG